MIDEQLAKAENAKQLAKTQYPWLSNFTLSIKDEISFFHLEILDFVNYVSPCH